METENIGLVAVGVILGRRLNAGAVHPADKGAASLYDVAQGLQNQLLNFGNCRAENDVGTGKCCFDPKERLVALDRIVKIGQVVDNGGDNGFVDATFPMLVIIRHAFGATSIGGNHQTFKFGQ